MAFPIPAEVGIAGVVAMFAIREISSLAKNRINNNSKKCIDHDSMQRNFRNNTIMVNATVEMKAIMQKLLESNIEQVILLKSLNGK